MLLVERYHDNKTSRALSWDGEELRHSSRTKDQKPNLSEVFLYFCIFLQLFIAVPQVYGCNTERKIDML